MNDPYRLAVFAAALAVLAARPAGAAIVDWTYTVDSSVFASGQMSITGPNAVFGDSVTAISGVFNGDAITGLVANPNAALYSYNSTGFVPYDNNIDPSTSSLDYFGIEFDVGTTEYNLASYNASPFTYTSTGPRSSVYTAENLFVNSGVLSVTFPPPTVPLYSGASGGISADGVVEPGTWAMMLLGAGILGLSRREARRRILTPA